MPGVTDASTPPGSRAADEPGDRSPLHISLSTVKTHLASVQAELGTRNRVEVASWAWRCGLVGHQDSG